MTTEKTYRVIKIPSEDSLVINVGTNNFFDEGDKIEVYVEGEDIKDPVTDEDLGKLYFIKDVLTITYASDQYSICQKKVTETEKLPSKIEAALSMSGLQSRIVTKEVTKKLEVFNDEITGFGISEEQMTTSIRVGDLIRKRGS